VNRRYAIGVTLGIVAALLVAESEIVASATTTTSRTGVGALPVRLQPVAQVDTPTAMAVRTGDSTLYVAEQSGRVVAVRDGGITGAALDLRKRVTSGGEQGLLGIAFSPDGSKLYVHFTDRDADTRIEEYSFVATPGGGGRAEPTSRRRILRVRDQESNHNGGQLAFGPDGMLYIGLGDGGGAGDEGPGHARGGNGQSLDTLLGKILRIDPHAAAGRAYTIPPDNPYADGGGRPEIWAFGLRNPWRFSFDRATGDLWIADVGQDAWEEIDLATVASGAGRGVNFGWNLFEARHRFRAEAPSVAAGGSPEAPTTQQPIVERSHDGGSCSITGGYVYRGTLLPDLAGAYVYADYCDGTLRWVRQTGGDLTGKGTLDVSGDSIASFGEGPDGELYVLSQTDGLLALTPARTEGPD
jgi:glucose/arabinose dehydrogenase